MFQRLHLDSGVHAGLRLAALLKVQRSQSGDWMGVSLKLAESWLEVSYSKADSLGHVMVWVRGLKQSDRGLGEVCFWRET